VIVGQAEREFIVRRKAAIQFIIYTRGCERVVRVVKERRCFTFDDTFHLLTIDIILSLYQLLRLTTPATH